LKPLRLNKVLGLSVGEKSLLAAEVVAGDRPDVKRVAEMVYPEGVSIADPPALGKALGEFLRDNKFTARNAVIGLPARWLVVKPKDVPPSDPSTLAAMLRLQAEGEFSAELKDLVYDYAADSVGHPRSVLLVATSRKYIDAVNAMCEAARLSPEIITSSAVALGVVTGRSVESKNPLVLLVSPAGAELTAQNGTASSAIRHMRGPGPDRPFVGELRRAISGMPPAGTNGTPRELVLWDAAGTSSFDAATLGESLGLKIRTGDLPILGVDTSEATRNGDGRKYAAAVSLALLGIVEETRPVDFLHSRLAPPKPPLVNIWMAAGVVAVLAVLAISYLVYGTIQSRQNLLDKINAGNAEQAPAVKKARAFNDMVDFAQAWHQGSPRYLACLRDLTVALPRDGQTYALSLSLHESPPPPNNALSPQEIQLQAAKVRTLAGQLEGKTTNQNIPQDVVKRLKQFSKHSPFINPELVNSTTGGRNRSEVTFTIKFTYNPPAGTP
jgi:hypothetical protein